jgi:dCTP deaminase
MILPDYKLIEWARNNGGLSPFEPKCVNPASVDLRWSGRYKIAYSSGWSTMFDTDKLTFTRGELYLLDTLEFITMPDDCAGELALKSSMGRQGLEHLHAGYVDPQFSGTLTLEIENRAPWPLTLTRGQRIVQLFLHRCESAPVRGYNLTGRYNGQCVPTEAK